MGRLQLRDERPSLDRSTEATTASGRLSPPEREPSYLALPRQTDGAARAFGLIGDALAAVLGTAAALAFTTGVPFIQRALLATCTTIVWLVATRETRQQCLYEIVPMVREVPKLLSSAMALFAAMSVMAILAKQDGIPLPHIGGAGALVASATAVVITACFHGIRRLYSMRQRHAGVGLRRALVITDAADVEGAVATMSGVAGRMGLDVVKVWTPTHGWGGALDRGIPVVGPDHTLLDLVDSDRVDTVVIVGDTFLGKDAMRDLGYALDERNVQFVMLPTLPRIHAHRIAVAQSTGHPMIHIMPATRGGTTARFKRLSDLIMAVGIFLLALPIMLVVAALIKLDSRGAIFYKQQRVGIDGKLFKMLKFRTMVPDADKIRREDAARYAPKDAGLLFKDKNDPRITRIGRVLRKYSIDELPQILNVLKGDMSLVGPRPHLPSEVENYQSEVHRRLLARPGMTGLWQVSGRSDLTWEENVTLDLEYVDNWSPLLDLEILIKTVRVVLSGEGAY